jgi:hypothetical protein
MRMQKIALTLVLSLGAFQAKAAFEENARRYLTAHEVIQTLQVYFELTPECKIVNNVNSSLLGLNSPVTGNPIAPSPTQSTVQWVATCVSSATAQFAIPIAYPVAYEKFKILVGPDVTDALAAPIPGIKQSKEEGTSYSLTKKWASLPADLRAKTVANMVLVMLGSDDVINDFGLIAPDLLRAKLESYANNKPDLSVLEIIKFISVNLSVRDEFLSY